MKFINKEYENYKVKFFEREAPSDGKLLDTVVPPFYKTTRFGIEYFYPVVVKYDPDDNYDPSYRYWDLNHNKECRDAEAQDLSKIRRIIDLNIFQRNSIMEDMFMKCFEDGDVFHATFLGKQFVRVTKPDVSNYEPEEVLEFVSANQAFEEYENRFHFIISTAHNLHIRQTDENEIEI